MRMRFMQIALVVLWVALPAHPQQSTRGWRGIVPLHSTRADVERVLGAPEHLTNEAVYRQAGEDVWIEYVISPCKGSLSGWNVPAFTVLRIQLISEKKELFSELKIDRSKYTRSGQDDSQQARYVNLEDGIEYEVLPDGVVYSVTYLPSIADSHLRCLDYPPYAGSSPTYRPLETYRDVTFADEKLRLDNLAIELQSNPTVKAYILLYAGRHSRVEDTMASGERAKEYLTTKRGIEPGRIFIVDGGHREESLTELYVLPRGLPSPSPIPTIPQGEAPAAKRSQQDD